MSRRRRGALLIAVMLALFGVAASGGEPGGNGFLNRADRVHDAVSRRLVGFSRWVDSFFGNRRVDDEFFGTRMRVTTAVEVLEGEGGRLRLRVDAKLALPRLQERIQLLLATFKADEGEEPGLPSDLVSEQDVRLAGLRFLIREKNRFRVHTDVGLRFRPEPDPEVRLRGRYLVLQDPFVIRVTQSVFWFREDGWGETSRVDLEKMIGERSFVRVTVAGTCSETSRGLEWSPGLSFWQALSVRRAVGIEWLAEGHTHPAWVLDRHRATFKYRQRVWRNWLYAQVASFAEFSRDRDYELAPGLALQIETVFGDPDRS